MKILQIFTDGSQGRKISKAGIGILFIDDDETERQYYYRVRKKNMYRDINYEYNSVFSGSIYISLMKQMNIQEIEMYAIYESIRKLIYYSKKYDKTIIYTDNDGVFEVLNGLYSTETLDRLKNIAVKKMYKLIMKLIYDNVLDIEFRWCKGHSGVYGNFIADKLATTGCLSYNLIGISKNRENLSGDLMLMFQNNIEYKI